MVVPRDSSIRSPRQTRLVPRTRGLLNPRPESGLVPRWDANGTKNGTIPKAGPLGTACNAWQRDATRMLEAMLVGCCKEASCNPITP